MKHNEKIIILDFGSQYTQLIVRKVRELGVYAEVYPFSIDQKTFDALLVDTKGVILSGGPSSVYAEDAPIPSVNLFNLQVPLLGICYGLQLIAHKNGGIVDKAAKREFGRASITIEDSNDLFRGIGLNSEVWMSHGDHLTKIPEDFDIIAYSHNSPICAIRSTKKQIWGVQFHPETHHSIDGKAILGNFLFTICKCEGNWSMGSFVEHSVNEIKQKVGDNGVICALSGGVDSTVAAVLLHKAIGNKLHCIHIDTGLMRKDESATIVKLFKEHFDISIDLIDAKELFYSRLNGVSDPETKRKIIGKTFIDLFEVEAKKFEDARFLAQGTLYPDVIESVSVKGPSATIKSHHNVGGLPEKMNLKLIEPFRELFKDEVRNVGTLLGIPEWFVERHPFPGPGLAIRIPGEITTEKILILQEADAIYIEEIKKAGLYKEIWQAFAVLLPVKTVGVMGDERTYQYVCALRAVTSTDGMTADWYPMPYDVLSTISNRICNEVVGINRVVYDISSKPPSTIEWE
ncbi:MAG: glutamine-hydrolyzing GMP synthase [Candidatus Kapabacteria bacterium]|nr:glutamine-hydrolyzing GMP synthase [Candidatus Kapabacteria bacterium]